MERKHSSHSRDGFTIRNDERTPLLSSGEHTSVNLNAASSTHPNQTPDVQVLPQTKEENSSQSFSFKALPSSKKWTVVMMAFANFAACTCFSLLAPFFPSEAAKKGASQTVVGLVFSCFELWIFVSAPVYGIFLTRIGSRFMFISGLFVCGICAVLFGVLDRCPPGTVFIVMCFVVRTVEALGASAFITASFAIIANEFPQHVATVFGTLETFSGLGLMVGPPIGGALYELGGYGLPFWVMGCLLVGCVLLTMLLLPAKPDNPRPKRGSLLLLLSSPLVLVTTITIVSGAFSLGFLDPTLAGHLKQFHLHTAIVGLIFIVAPGIYALTAPLWGYLSDSKGIFRPLIAAGNLVSVGVFLLLGPSPLLPFLKHELWLVIVSLAILGLSVGCAMVSTLKCLLLGAKQVDFEDNLDTYGLVSGLFNSAFSLGTFIGPTVGSVIQEYAGFDWASTVTAGMFAFATVVFVTYLVLEKSCPRRGSQSPHSAGETDSHVNASHEYSSPGTTIVVSYSSNSSSGNTRDNE